MDLKQNKKRIENAVLEATKAANRSETSVQVIAVTKYVDTETTRALLETGVQHIGENRVDRFLEKKAELMSYPVTWHFIGTLQSRKVKEVINEVDYFHALDRLSLAKEIQKRAEHDINCFLQVNISEEASKHGFSVSELPEVLKELATYDRIRLVGLMTMAPIDATDEELAKIFAKANEIRKSLAATGQKNMPFTELSMGMTRDFKQAIAHGATFVRIGTAFFN